MADQSAATAQLQKEAALTQSGQSKAAQSSSASFIAANKPTATNTTNPATQELMNEAKATTSGNSKGAQQQSASYIAGTKQPTATAALNQQAGLEQSGQNQNAQAASLGYQSTIWSPPPTTPPTPVVQPNPTVTAPTVMTASQANEQNQKNTDDLNKATSSMNQGNNLSGTTGNVNGNQINTVSNQNAPTSSGVTTTTNPDGSVTTTTPAAPTPADQVNAQLQSVNDALDSATAQYQSSIRAIQNGTFALSPADQATLSAIQSSIDQSVANQKLINQNMAGAVTEAGIRNGLQRYAPEVNAGLIGAQLSAGAAAIAKIESDGQQQLATAQQAIETKDMTLLNDSMNAFRATMQAKSQTIQQMYQNTMDYQKFTAQQAQQAAQAAATSVDALTKAGVSSDQLSSDQLSALDAKSGYPPGTTAALLDAGVAQAQAADQAAQIKNASALIDTLNKLPPGQTVTINGVDYASLNQGQTQVFSEDDGQGNTTIISYNKDTGAMISHTLQGVSKQDGWQFSQQNGVGLFVNPQTGQMKVAFDGNLPNGGTPTGGSTTAFPPGTQAGECGVFCDTITNVGNVGGDTYAGKLAKASIKDPSQVTTGDIAVMPAGSTGHVAVVLSSTKLPDGSYSMTVQDSNWGLDGKVQIHQINSNQITGYIPAQLKPEFQTGTGTDPTQQALKDYAGSTAINGLTGQQTSDAIAKGYTTAEQQKQYAAMVKDGTTPPELPNSPKAVSALNQKFANLQSTANKSLQDVWSYFSSHPNVEAILPNAPFGLSPARTAEKVANSTLEDSVVSLLTGRGVSYADAKKQVDDLMPSFADSDANIKTKFGHLQSLINGADFVPGGSSGSDSSTSSTGGDQYASFRSQLQPGQILATDGTNIVAITQDDLDQNPGTYTQL